MRMIIFDANGAGGKQFALLIMAIQASGADLINFSPEGTQVMVAMILEEIQPQSLPF